MPQSNKVELKVVQKSAFPGKSHFNQGTAKVGSLVPILVDELIPNTTVDIKMAVAASLPPLAGDVFMNLDYCVEAFFVPMRQCYGGYEGFFTQVLENQFKDWSSSDVGIVQRRCAMPRLEIDCDEYSDSPVAEVKNIDLTILSQPHNLFDYFECAMTISNANDCVFINPLPYVAYNLIWDSWYRNSLVQKSAFAKPYAFGSVLGDPSSRPFQCLPFVSCSESDATFSPVTGCMTDIEYEGYGASDSAYLNAVCFADGHPFWHLRQRNFGFDYFTNAWPSPQNGAAQTVQADANGKITIAAIRGANSLQQFEETGLFVGRLVEGVHVRYGAHLSDAIAQRPICLGSGRYPVVSKSIDVTAANGSGNQNPFAGHAGAQVARGYANGVEHIIDNFTAQEPGYLMILGSLVPSVTYSSGVNRINTRYQFNVAGQRVELADPLLQNAGNQPIYRYELDGSMSGQDESHPAIFGYTDRFADWMVKRSSVHGLLRERYYNGGVGTTGSLSMFVAQRMFAPGNGVSINDNFLTIPTSYLDNVTAVADNLSDYGYWYEVGFNYKCSMPLAQYSIPSLQNPAYEHGETITAHRGGFRF